MAKRQCFVCRDPIPPDWKTFCGAECRQVVANIHASHLNDVEPPVKVWVADDGREARAEPVELVYLYGVLTYPDALELRRRQAMFAAAGRVFPTTEPEPERSP